MSPLDGNLDNVEWLREDGQDTDVVMSSRIRLARNVAGLPFPKAARREQRLEVLDIARKRVVEGRAVPNLQWIDLNDISTLERLLLVERHLVSKQHSKGSDPRAVLVDNPGERIAIMVNEEDHFRVQVMRRGLALADCFGAIDEIDDHIESQVDYAFSDRFGYLTACPTNVGAGIRISVMLHLPALKLTGDIEKVGRAAKGLNLAVRGFYGEGSEAAGDIYQLSNQTTLGKSERTLLDEFERELVPQIIDFERNARESLMNKRRLMLEDRAFRALGLLLHARLLSAEETLQALSQVRLGVLTGLFPAIDIDLINRLVLLTQPAHLQKAAGREMDQAERRVARAVVVREQLGRAG